MPNDTFTPEQIAQILEAFFDAVGTRQYIGARYVPIFGRRGEDSIEWDNTGTYEPLTVVLYQGNSYTSRQFVPVGVEITNQSFWAQTGNFNAQVEQYRQAVLQLSNDLNALADVVAGKIPYFTTIDNALESDMSLNTIFYVADRDAMFSVAENETPNNIDCFAMNNNYFAKMIIVTNTLHIAKFGGNVIAFNYLVNKAKAEANLIVCLDGVELTFDIYPESLHENEDATTYNGLIIDGCDAKLSGAQNVRFDRLQLNNVHDITIRNLSVTVESVGSNGISITGDSGNITLQNIEVVGATPIITTYLDGGKAFTLQPASNDFDGLTIENCRCSNCFVGFEFDYQTANYNNITIKNNTFDALYAGIIFSGSAINQNLYNLVICDNVILSQVGINLTRVKHCSVARNVINLSHTGFVSYDLVSNAMRIIATTDISVTENTIVGAYENSVSIQSLTGVPCSKLIVALNNFNGDTASFDIVSVTSSQFIANIYTGDMPTIVRQQNLNNIVIGIESLIQSVVASNVSLLYNNNPNVDITNDVGSLKVKQTYSSSPTQDVLKIVNNADNKVFAVKNNGYVEMPMSNGAVGGSQSHKIPIYSGATIAGYIPVYVE